MQRHNQEMLQLRQIYRKLVQENNQLNQENSQLREGNSRLKKEVKGYIDKIQKDGSIINQCTGIIKKQENLIHCLEKDSRTLVAIHDRMHPFLMNAAKHYWVGPGSRVWPTLPTNDMT